MHKKGWAFNALNYLFFIILGFVTLYPFWDVLMGSIMPYSEYISLKIRLYPRSITFEAYRTWLMQNDVLHTLSNTLYVTIIGTALSILVTTMAAYALSRKVLWGRRIIMYAVTFTMMFGGGLIPLYMVMRSLGLIDKLSGLVLLGAVNSFYLIVMKSYFGTLPDSLEESAKLDGAGYFIILFRIIIPISMPIIATIVLFYSVDRWNDLYAALIFINSNTKEILQVTLYKMINVSNAIGSKNIVYTTEADITPETQKMAAIMIVTIPILVVYPFLQKYFTKGVMIGSIKE